MVDFRDKSDRNRAKARIFKSKLKKDVFVPRNFAILIIPLLMIGWFAGTISLLNRIWELQREINALDTEYSYLEVETASLELEGQYYQSEEYQELSARRLLNKQMPGETMIYLPENSDAAKNKYASSDETAEQSAAISNFEQWMRYLFGS